MTLQRDERFRAIVARASSLKERLRLPISTCPLSPEETLKADHHLSRWCEVAAEGDLARFEKRVAWDGLALPVLRAVLGAPPPPPTSLPSWTEILAEIACASTPPQITTPEWCEFASVKPLSATDPQKPLPFEDLLLPVVYVAQQRLRTSLGCDTNGRGTTGSLWETLSSEARRDLERGLLAELTDLCGKTFAHEFTQHANTADMTDIGREFAMCTASNQRDGRYRLFVQSVLDAGLLSIFDDYPVLGRLVCTRLAFWVTATSELVTRLHHDLAEINHLFDCTADLGQVVEIKPALSDSHHDGRRVARVIFASGLQIVYKPKGMGLEMAYQRLLTWCTNRGELLPLRSVAILERPDYAWIEFVQQQGCIDEAGVRRYYERAGMLLCLLYLLGATDCHYENLIASGEHPVIIDLETLLHHEVKLMDDTVAAAAVDEILNKRFWDSVLRTGLLPRWDFSEDSRMAYDISALGSTDQQPTPQRVARWQHVNTDAMRLTFETGFMPLQRNAPSVDGRIACAASYVTEIINGLTDMYRFLSRHREALLGPCGPIEAFCGQRTRFIFRATAVYAKISRRCLSHLYMRDGVERSIELDYLCRAFLTARRKPAAWPILGEEMNALERGDIPYFSASTGESALADGLPLPIPEYFKAPSYDGCVMRLESFSEQDLAQQIAIVRGTLLARGIEGPASQRGDHVGSGNESSGGQRRIPESAELLKAARKLANEIEDRAIRAADGTVSWVGMTYTPKARRFQYQPLDTSLYNGQCGIAFFLAALDHVSGKAVYRGLALGALKRWQVLWRDAHPDFADAMVRLMGLGAGMGVGSVVYAFVTISRFLNAPELLEDAKEAVRHITPAAIAHDQQYDVLSGAAGCILGLLSLHKATGDDDALGKAILCGHHLLAHRISADGSPRAWRAFSDKPLVGHLKGAGNQPLIGFSHGAAGIAFALLRLYAVTHDSVWAEAAEEAMTYERSFFSPTEGNWPDLLIPTKPGDRHFSVRWCSGAAGIGLARLGGLGALTSPEILNEIATAVGTSERHGPHDVDYPCCGTLGLIELLREGGLRLNQPHWITSADNFSAQLIARASSSGSFRLFTEFADQPFNPSLFKGTSGIGYSLLRLAAPKTLPCFMLWE